MADAATTPDTQFFLSAIDTLRDPSRSTRWKMILPSNIFEVDGRPNLKNTNAGDIFLDATNDFSLHVKSCKIPEIKLTHAEHNYMGFKSAFVTNADISADIAFTAIALEDFRAYEAMLMWHQTCMNTGLLGPDGDLRGVKLGLGHHKDGKVTKVLRNTTVAVEMYNWYTGKVILKMSLYNAMPTTISGWDMSYDSPKLNMFNFTLHCDRWKVEITKDGGDDANILPT